MIVLPNDIYEEVAEDIGVDVAMIQSIGVIAFQELRHSLNNPVELAYELPKLGTFILRFNKFEDYFDYFQKKLDNKDVEALQKLEDNPELYLKNKALKEKINNFRKDKQTKRKQRYEKDYTN